MLNLEHPRPHLREPKKLEKTNIKIDVKKKKKTFFRIIQSVKARILRGSEISL